MENRVFKIILYSLLPLNFVTYTKLGIRVLLYKQKMLLFLCNYGGIFQRRMNLIMPQNIISFSLPLQKLNVTNACIKVILIDTWQY